jgi:RimJ/RimL family protein N-acetyltransferase
MTESAKRRDSFLLRLPYRVESLSHRIVPKWLFHPRWCYLYSMPVTKRNTTRNASGNDSHTPTFRWATDEDRRPLQEQAGRETIDGRFAAGHRGATLWDGDALIGTAWFAMREYLDDETQTKIELAPDQCWLFGSWVHRDCRNRGYYGRMISEAATDLASRGIREIVFAVDASNFVSQRVHQALGAVRAGSLVGTRLCGLRLYKVSLKRHH